MLFGCGCEKDQRLDSLETGPDFTPSDLTSTLPVITLMLECVFDALLNYSRHITNHLLFVQPIDSVSVCERHIKMMLMFRCR